MTNKELRDATRRSSSPFDRAPSVTRSNTDPIVPIASKQAQVLDENTRLPNNRRKSADSIEHNVDPALMGEEGRAELLTAKPKPSGGEVAAPSEAHNQIKLKLKRSPMSHGAWPLQTDLPAGAGLGKGSTPGSLVTDDSAMDSSSVLTDDESYSQSFFDSRQSSVANLQDLRGAEGESEVQMGDGALGGDEGGGVPAPKPKKSHAKKMPPGHIKRARNAFILYRKHITDQGLIPASVEVKHQNISVIAAKMWREAPHEVRATFQEQARIEKEEHQRLYPDYRYQPVFRRTDIVRRRVRKDPAEDDKVEAVAEALIKGKTGEKLETEIREQMAARSEESGSESDASVQMSRRRRETGQLSKGALRAKRAAQRAKQMRQDLLGANLLHMSMYNNAHHQQANEAAVALQAQRMGAAYGMPTYSDYAPVGYDYDGRPLFPAIGAGGGISMGFGAGLGVGMGMSQERSASPMILPRPLEMGGVPANSSVGLNVDYSLPPPGGLLSVAGAAGGQDLAGGAEGMYRLPPIDANMSYNQEGSYGSVSNGYGNSYVTDGSYGSLQNYAGSGTNAGAQNDISYQANDTHSSGTENIPPLQLSKNIDPRLKEWSSLGEQKTPSRDVLFDDRLFDGALGSADVTDGGERIPAFDEALEQANGVY